MKIMAALDLSDYGDFVLTKAIKTARQQNAKMDIVVVVEEINSMNDHGESENKPKQFEEATRAARNYQQKAIDQGIKAKVRVLSGNSAAEEILKYQKSENLDLIVLGRTSQINQSPAPLGPVAERVVGHATCTVMVVRCMEEKDLIS